ncbi:hypothetical protein HY410_01770 [Candidatus Gottesmanbacteria bacterium]|nr:hypothetical protein [Candidatus Gottesmanbacteria bacterium]
MRIVPDVASVIGPTTETRWGQALITPSLYGVIEVSEAAGDAMKLGIEVLTKLTRATPPMSMSDLATIVQIPQGRWISTVLLLVPIGRVVYIVLRGEGRVYLKRGEQLSTLIEGARGISGKVAEGDILLLSTGSFTKALGSRELLNSFDHDTARSIAEKLTFLLHKREGAPPAGGGGAALIFEVKRLEEEGTQPADSRESTGASRLRDRLTVLPKRTMLLGSLTAFIALFFIVSIVVGVIRQQDARKSGEATKILAEAQRALEEGNALLDLNPVKGRERLQAAYDLLSPLAQTISPKTTEGRQVSELFAQVSEQLKLSKNSVSQEPVLFYEAGLLKEGSTIGSVGIYEKVAALLDTQSATVYELDTSSKNGQIVAGGAAYTGSKLLAIHGETIYVLIRDGINAVRRSDRKTTPTVVGKTDEWKIISAIVSYGGNLYLLDTGASRIWKYVATENGFSRLSEYLNPDTFVDFSQGTSMAIDGTIWVGTSDGKILRFVGGKQETFVPQGVEPAFGGSLALFTSDGIKNLYVLDVSNKRVVVLDKDGVYLGQYVWQGDFLPTQLVVSEADKKILLLAGGKLYSLDLK